MQNWDSSLQPANYENNWYGNIFPQIKMEPQQNDSSPTSTSPPLLVMDHYLNMKHQNLHHHQQQQQQQQKQQSGIDLSSSLTPSPRTDSNEGHSFYDTQNCLTQSTINHINNQNNNNLNHQQQLQHPLGFNPLTPPGLPNAILPPINFHNHNNDLQLDQTQQTRSLSSSNKLDQNSQQENELQKQEQQQQQQQQSIINENDSIQTKIDNDNSLTPRNTPPIDITPPKSPKLLSSIYNNNHSDYLTDKDHEILSNSSDLIDESDNDDDTIRMPIYNSHGKMKNYKCKSCGYMAITKIAFWQHTRSHMKPEKILQCPKCPFVTELKHHLEYHIRKHKNLKPFQCDKCNYSCVNKSMLNSHLKSHSSVYQYRCSDCDYATKYCHSFKLHLRKYDHKPGIVLDDEGLPNPSVIIDVYGTRRGPKMKSGHHGNCNNNNGRISKSSLKESRLSSQAKLSLGQQIMSPVKSDSLAIKNHHIHNHNNHHHHQHQSSQQQQQQQQQQHQSTGTNMQNFLPNPLANMFQQQRNMTQFFPYWNLNLQMFAAQQQAVLAQLSPRMREAAIQSLNNNNNNFNINNNINRHDDKELIKLDLDDDTINHNNNNNEDDNDNDDEDDHRSESSAMDLSSQGTPTKLNNSNNNIQLNKNELFKINNNNSNNDINTPTITSTNCLRRKGRVLKLDTILQNKELSPNNNDDNLIKLNDEMECTTTEESNDKSIENELPTSSSTTSSSSLASVEKYIKNKEIKQNELIESNNNSNGNASSAAIITTTTSSTSNNRPSSQPPITQVTQSIQSNCNTNTSNNNNTPISGIFECKYCDIYFKDAVLYTIHMGYHSCDDVFKCNMCGEKCDGPVGLFVHMARNAHS